MDPLDCFVALTRPFFVLPHATDYSVWTHRSKDPAWASGKEKSTKIKADKILAGEAEIDWNTASVEGSREQSLENHSGRDLSMGTPISSHPTSPSGADLSGRNLGTRQLGRAASFNPRNGSSNRLSGTTRNQMPRSGSSSSVNSIPNVFRGSSGNMQPGGGLSKVAGTSSPEGQAASDIMQQRATRALVQEEVKIPTPHTLNSKP